MCGIEVHAASRRDGGWGGANFFPACGIGVPRRYRICDLLLDSCMNGLGAHAALGRGGRDSLLSSWDYHLSAFLWWFRWLFLSKAIQRMGRCKNTSARGSRVCHLLLACFPVESLPCDRLAVVLGFHLHLFVRLSPRLIGFNIVWLRVCLMSHLTPPSTTTTTTCASCRTLRLLPPQAQHVLSTTASADELLSRQRREHNQLTTCLA
jgi:hypothetical protein